MLTPAEFSTLLSVHGEPVVLTRAKAPQGPVNLRAIIQNTARAPENVVNAYGLTGRTVQFLASAMAVPPEKFDTVTRATGEEITLDLVEPVHQRGTGSVSYYVAYAKGAA